MKILTEPINKAAVLSEHNHYFGTMIKAVVDVRQSIMAIDAELHADLESLLLERTGSQQQELWGINLFLDKPKNAWIEYTALVNIRPSAGNRSMEVEDPGIRDRIRAVVERLIND